MASLCFDTESLQVALELVGRPEVDLVLGHGEGSLHRAGCLEPLQPSGTSTLLSSGWAALGVEDGSVTLTREQGIVVREWGGAWRFWAIRRRS